MSKNRTNINHSLFRSNPVPIKNTKGSDHNKNLFIKGNKDATFELKKGHDNVYLIKTSDNKRFEFDRHSFLDTLTDLKKYSHNPIRILEGESKEKFTKIMNAIEMLYKTGKLYDLIHNDIQSIYDDVKIVIPGTIAAYFIGCSSNDNFAGPMGCNPKCAASLVPGGKNHGEYSCEDLVLMYENDGSFSSLNQRNSKHAYIHIGDINFKGFTENNIKELDNANISSVTLTHSKADGSYEDPTSAMPIDKLPLLSQTQVVPSDDNGAWILFIIIIAIIIILLLIFLYQSYARQSI
jgi:hypothetical protein